METFLKFQNSCFLEPPLGNSFIDVPINDYSRQVPIHSSNKDTRAVYGCHLTAQILNLKEVFAHREWKFYENEFSCFDAFDRILENPQIPLLAQVGANVFIYFNTFQPLIETLLKWHRKI